MKKFIRQLTIFSLIFIMTFGVGFSSQKGINVQAATTQTTTTNDGKLRKNGVLFTGISDNKYYKRGVFTKYTGWKNWKGNRYYLKKGKAVTGWKYLRDYSGSRTKYKYYFKKNGRLSKDLFKTFGSSYKKKRMKLELNLVTHNITFLLYDGKTNKYDIPAKTVVCSTARDGRSTYVGNHYLSKGTARSWFIYKKSNPWHYYQWGVFVNKLKEIQAVVFDMDGLMFDSERYVQKSWDIAGERLGYGPLGHNIVNTLGTNLTNRKKYFLEHYGNDFPFDKFLDGYRDAYYELVEDGVPAKKGLHEILKVLREKGLKIGVATSSSEEHAVSNLKREGIFDYFDSVITGNMIEHGKPEPDIYIEACRQLKVDPSKAIALEDAINGIRSAHGAGMNPVMIPDIVQDTSKVDDILFGKCESLLEFAEILQGVTLDIEETQK